MNVANEKDKTIFLISHTHFDREWWKSFQQFRFILCEMINTLLDIMDNNPDFNHFMLDGQTIILEDYLQVFPNKENKLKDLIKTEKIAIGPWYVLPDEFLVSPESLIRNLQFGQRAGKKFGKIMNVGYLPDSFGHVSQMPQILNGFNINSFVYTRGNGEEIDDLGLEFKWKTPDGSSVLAINQHKGYGNCARLGNKFKGAEIRVNNLLKEIKNHSKSTKYLLMNGSDHLYPEESIPEFVNYYNERNDNKIQHVSLQEFVKEISNEFKNVDLKEYQGEFRGSKYHNLLPGVFSARIYLKILNNEIELLLEKWTEPFSSINWLIQKNYPEDYIQLAWKYLLQNHPHDSICGCSIDSVHEDMLYRFRASRDIANEIIFSSLTKLAENINFNTYKKKEIPIIVFNPHNWTRTDIVEFHFPLVNWSIDTSLLLDLTEGAPKSFILEDLNGNQIPIYKRKIPKHLDLRNHITIKNRDYILEFLAENVPPIGYKVYKLKTAPSRKINKIPSKIKVTDNSFENDYYKITFNDDGSFNLFVKSLNKELKDLHVFEDGGDCGDEYNYSKPEQDNVVLSTNFQPKRKLIENNAIFAEFVLEYNVKIPKSLDKNDKEKRSINFNSLYLNTSIKIYNQIERIDFTTKIKNTCQDHRLRVLFPLPINPNVVKVDGHFITLERKIDIKEHLDWQEPPSRTNHQRKFINLSNENLSFSLINKGIPEYEVYRDENESVVMALTLLRCVGWLSRDDLTSRSDNAGPSIRTPGAQCLGEQVFEYSIIPHGNNLIKDKIQQKAHDFNSPLKAVHVINKSGNLDPQGNSFFKLDSDMLIISAIKKCELDESLILRFHNISNEMVSGNLESYFLIKEVNQVKLDELTSENSIKLNATKNNVEMKEIKPYQIVTLKIFVD